MKIATCMIKECRNTSKRPLGWACFPYNGEEHFMCPSCMASHITKSEIVQPERSKREDDEDPVMKYLAPLCDTIIRLD